MHRYIQGLASLALTGMLVHLVAGCSAQQTYQAGQTWQRNECQKLNDAQARSKCLDSASASYDAYQRQVESGTK